MNKIFGLLFLFLATHAGISFGMNEALDIECVQLRAKLAIQQGRKSLLMTYPSSEFSKYAVDLEIKDLESRLAIVDVMREHQEQERDAMVARGQQNVAQMRQKRDDLEFALYDTQTALYGLEITRTAHDPEVADRIAACKLKIMDLKLQIKQIDDLLTLFV